MNNAAPDPPNPRRIKLLVEGNGVTLLQSNDRSTPVWVGSGILVRSHQLEVVSGNGFKRTKNVDPWVEWIATLGTTPEGQFVLAIPTGEDTDGHVIFEKFGTYLVGHPNYLRMLSRVPSTRKSSWDRTFVQNPGKVRRSHAKRKWA